MDSSELRGGAPSSGGEASALSSGGRGSEPSSAGEAGAPSSAGQAGALSSVGEGGASGSGKGGALSSAGEGGASGSGKGGALNSAGEGGAASPVWETLPGLARDIAHGADGSAWIVGVDSVGYGDLGISKWVGSVWASANGGGVRIGVAPNGVPWTVNAAGEIYRHSSAPDVGLWEHMSGSATDIALGADGSVWIVAANNLGNGDFGICKWNGLGWDATDGGAVRIAVAPDGVPWIVNTAGEIYRRTSYSPWEGSWQVVDGQARDIAVGADGSIWIIGNERVGFDDFRIAVWNAQSSDGGWVSADGAGVALSVDPSGAPWIVNAAGLIQRFRGELNRSP